MGIILNAAFSHLTFVAHIYKGIGGRMIKLLLVSPKTEQSKGGIAVWTDIFLNHCDDAALDCDLVNIATIGARAAQGNAKRHIVDEFKRTAAIFKNLRRFLTTETYNVAHINTSCGAFGLIRDYLTVYKIKRAQPQCRRVVHFHCDIQTQCISKLSLCILKRLLNVTDVALVLNEKNARFLKNRYMVNASVVANFVEELIVRTDEKVISPIIRKAVFVGYVQPAKGVREIYELASRLPLITFRLIGEVHDEVMGWDKPLNVVLCGPLNRDGVTAVLDEADVFIFPSHSEGFSMALLESMARGLPAIATAVGANAEMLEEHGGLVVDVEDVDAMERAMCAMQPAHARAQMSAWAVQKVKTQYTALAVIDRLKQVYTQSF